DGSDHALLLGVTIPLASRDLVEGATAEARARSLQVDDRARASRIALEADFYALYQDLNHVYTELQIMDREVLPQIQQALEQTRCAYERGRYGYVEWLAVQRELLEARRTKLDALARLHQYRIEIERLTGTALGAEQ
ncbi:MAG: TolC family protein, partial [Steroidobacteraceae bacterium]